MSCTESHIDCDFIAEAEAAWSAQVEALKRRYFAELAGAPGCSDPGAEMLRSRALLQAARARGAVGARAAGTLLRLCYAMPDSETGYGGTRSV
eukprot:2513911-Rhodomonas_salina.2